MPARRTFHAYVVEDGRDILPEPLVPFADHFNLMQHRMLTRRWQWQTDEKTGTFTILKRQYIEKELTCQIAGKLLRWGKDSGVLVTNNHWEIGRTSMGYKFRSDLNDRKAKRVLLTDDGLLERIRLLERREYKKYTKAHRHLRAWLDEVSIGCEALRIATGDDLTAEQKQASIGAVTMMLNRDLQFNVCDYGRVHTNLTRLYKPLRRFLRVEGWPLVNVDIANSQPLFLALAFLSHLAGQQESFPEEFSEQVPPIRSQNDRFESCNCQWEHEDTCEFYLSELGTRLPHHPSLNSDVKAYLQTCCDGLLYQTIMREMNWMGTKEAFKAGCWFQFLYGANKTERLLEGKDDLRRLNEAFRRLFPTIYDFIWEKKRTNYKQLSRDMQRAESRLMIDNVGSRLREEHQDIPVLTIHDSYMTTAPHVETVAGIIMDEFRKFDVTPTLGIEDYSKEIQAHEEEEYYEDEREEREER